MSDWTEHTSPRGVDDHKFRYRQREDGRWELEYWHDIRREWREVRNADAAWWFGVGIEVGRSGQVEMKLSGGDG